MDVRCKYLTFISYVGNNHISGNSSSIASPAVPNISHNSSIETRAPDTLVSKACLPPKPFTDETEEAKLSMILKWIFGIDSYEGILIRNEKITNITTRLDNMKFNGYLRLFEIETNTLKSHMTQSSTVLFEDFKKKHEKDAWKCPQCSKILQPNHLKWKCARCLHWYHEKCIKERKIKRQENTSEEYALCNSCLFKL